MSFYKSIIPLLVPRANVNGIPSLNYKNCTVRVKKNAMSAILNKFYVHADGLEVLPDGNFLTSDRDVNVEYRCFLGLEKAQWFVGGGQVFLSLQSVSSSAVCFLVIS